LDTTKKNTQMFLKSQLNTNQQNPSKFSLFSFPFKNVQYYEIKSKISSTLVQLSVHFLLKQNEQQRNLKDLKEREESFEQFE